MLRTIKRFYRSSTEQWLAELRCSHVINVSEKPTSMEFIDLSKEPSETFVGVKFECSECADLRAGVLRTLQGSVAPKIPEVFSFKAMSDVEPSGRLQIVLDAVDGLKLQAIKHYLEAEMIRPAN